MPDGFLNFGIISNLFTMCQEAGVCMATHISNTKISLILDLPRQPIFYRYSYMQHVLLDFVTVTVKLRRQN